jgi:hypothetical protein
MILAMVLVLVIVCGVPAAIYAHDCRIKGLTLSRKLKNKDDTNSGAKFG